MAGTLFQDNLSPYLTVVEGSAPSSPSAGNQRLFVDSSDHLFKLKNSSGTVTALSTNPMTTSGDIIYGGASGVPTRLAKGSDGNVLTLASGLPSWASAGGGGGLSSGSSFPGSPSTNDIFYRTDRALLYYYDGTRWLTVNLYRETLGQSATTMPVSTNNQSLARMTPWASTYDLWLDAFYSSTFPAGTNTGSHYWTMTLQKADLSDSKTTVTSFNTSAHTASNWTQVRTAIGASYTASSYRELDVQATVTGSPGSIYWVFALAYRLIG